MLLRLWLLSLIASAAVGGLVAVGAILVIMPPVTRAALEEQSLSQVIRAQRLELVDRNGSARGVLALSDEGAAYLQLRDQDEVGRLELRVRRQEAMIVVGGNDSAEQFE